MTAVNKKVDLYQLMRMGWESPMETYVPLKPFRQYSFKTMA